MVCCIAAIAKLTSTEASSQCYSLALCGLHCRTVRQLPSGSLDFPLTLSLDPKSSRSSKWLTTREQEYLEVRLTENAPKTGDSAFSKSEILASLKDPRTYSFCLMQVLMNLGGYGLQWQLPTVTTSLGFAGLPRNQLLNIPPAAATVFAIIFAGWFLGRAYLTRPEISMFICAGAFAFFIVLCVDVPRTATYMACIFGMMFYSVYFIPFWACKCHTLPPPTDSLTCAQGDRHLWSEPRVRPSHWPFSHALVKWEA